MDLTKYRILSIYIVIANLIVLILYTILFWNSTVKQTIDQNLIWLIIMFIANIVLILLLFGLAYKSSDMKARNNAIQSAVNEERTKILTAIEEEKKKTEKVDFGKDIKTVIRKLIPSSKIKNIDSYCRKLLVNLAGEFELTQGIIYLRNTKGKEFKPVATFAIKDEDKIQPFEAGIGLNGEVAKSKEILHLSEIPDEYFDTESGLGKAKPKNILIAPIVSSGRTIGVIEMGSFKAFDEKKTKTAELVLSEINNILKQLK